jgi:NADPH:quinone reductase
MRVVQVREYGPVDVLRPVEIEQPARSEGQVLIQVELAVVLFGDTIVRRGEVGFPLPYIPGMEIGGEVVAADDPSLVGKRVVASTAGFSGGYAEYALAEPDQVHVVPSELSMEHAVALFGAGGFAAGLLNAIQVRPEDTVLITAAAGRIGSLLVQLAKARGARVIGAVGGAQKLEAATRFGADLAVDYRRDGWTEQVEASVILDAIGGEVGEQAIATATDRVGIYGSASGTWPRLDSAAIGERGLTVAGVLGPVRRRSVAEQRADVVQALNGSLKPGIHAVYPLEDAAQAHADLEQRRNIGAVLLRVK